jgi:hypothetical protein
MEFIAIIIIDFSILPAYCRMKEVKGVIMLFLTPSEAKEWQSLGRMILADKPSPSSITINGQSTLHPIFHFYAGALLASNGHIAAGKEWFTHGAMLESRTVMSNAYVSAFIDRRKGRFDLPAVVFADPRPYLHFTSTPAVKKARESFHRHCTLSLPEFKKPFRIMDLGCGDGGMLVQLLNSLRQAGNIHDIDEILLVDSSQAMLELAVKTVRLSFPGVTIRSLRKRIQDIPGSLSGHYDVALSSLAYHHMPMEIKIETLHKIKDHFNHFIIFELDANHDTPELHSPELACSVFQCYGTIIDFIFSHDAPLDVVLNSVDCFLLAEMISLLTQARGIRNDYHMLRHQWHQLFSEVLGGDSVCLNDSTCFENDFLGLITVHYGK